MDATLKRKIYFRESWWKIYNVAFDWNDAIHLIFNNLWGTIKRKESMNSIVPGKIGRWDFQAVLKQVLLLRNPSIGWKC